MPTGASSFAEAMRVRCGGLLCPAVLPLARVACAQAACLPGLRSACAGFITFPCPCGLPPGV